MLIIYASMVKEEDMVSVKHHFIGLKIAKLGDIERSENF